MEPFKSFKAMGLPIDIANCDTDAIIPARFLRIPLDDPDYHSYLFHDLRFNEDGSSSVASSTPAAQSSSMNVSRSSG